MFGRRELSIRVRKQNRTEDMAVKNDDSKTKALVSTVNKIIVATVVTSFAYIAADTYRQIKVTQIVTDNQSD